MVGSIERGRGSPTEQSNLSTKQIYSDLEAFEEMPWKINITCFADPLEVSLKGFGEVFSHSKFSKRFPSLHSRSFIAELSVNIFKSWITVTVDIYITLFR